MDSGEGATGRMQVFEEHSGIVPKVQRGLHIGEHWCDVLYLLHVVDIVRGFKYPDASTCLSDLIKCL